MTLSISLLLQIVTNCHGNCFYRMFIGCSGPRLFVIIWDYWDSFPLIGSKTHFYSRMDANFTANNYLKKISISFTAMLLFKDRGPFSYQQYSHVKERCQRCSPVPPISISVSIDDVCWYTAFLPLYFINDTRLQVTAYRI